MKVKRARKVKVEGEPVYDLSVPLTQTFCLANGCVVHNSKDVADSLAGVVYGLTTRRELWAKHEIPMMKMPASVTQASSSVDKQEQEG